MLPEPPPEEPPSRCSSHRLSRCPRSRRRSWSRCPTSCRRSRTSSRSRSRSSLPPEDQPELPERLVDIVQLPPPQLELPLVMPPLDHFEPLSMFQDQLPMRPFQDQRPEFQPIGQPCFIQCP